MRIVYLYFSKGPDIIKKAFNNLKLRGYLKMQDAIFPLTSVKGLENTELRR